MHEIRHGEGRYIANWFAQRWSIEQEVQIEEDRIPKLNLTSAEAKDMKGGAAYPIGYFEDDPETERLRLLGKLDAPPE